MSDRGSGTEDEMGVEVIPSALEADGVAAVTSIQRGDDHTSPPEEASDDTEDANRQMAESMLTQWVLTALRDTLTTCRTKWGYAINHGGAEVDVELAEVIFGKFKHYPNRIDAKFNVRAGTGGTAQTTSSYGLNFDMPRTSEPMLRAGFIVTKGARRFDIAPIETVDDENFEVRRGLIGTALFNEASFQDQRLVLRTWLEGNTRRGGALRVELTTTAKPGGHRCTHVLSDEQWSLRADLPKLTFSPAAGMWSPVSDALDEVKLRWAIHIIDSLWAMALADAYRSGGSQGLHGLTSTDVLPPLAVYRPRRPVDLKPTAVWESLGQGTDNEGSLKLPWDVVESACSALNMGKHIILTGPPGCGKSRFARVLARAATAKDPLIATASPAWSVGEVIGRYFPAPDGQSLRVQHGFFLRAILSERWFMIDEFNRTDIDACFGELFTVLERQPVELPLEEWVERDKDDTKDKTRVMGRVRLLPAFMENEDDTPLGARVAVKNYVVPETFRIIGTMNDADRSGLRTLSFALQRRFAIIQLRAPEQEAVIELCHEALARESERLTLDTLSWRVNWGKRVANEERCLLATAVDELTYLFAGLGTTRPAGPLTKGLIGAGVVGVSIMQDTIRFVAEGLRGDNEMLMWHEPQGLRTKRDAEVAAEELVISYLAMAVMLFVIPQVEALPADEDARRGRDQPTRREAILHTIRALEAGPDGTQKHDRRFLAVRKEAQRFTLHPHARGISSFIEEKVRARLPHLDLEPTRSDG